MSTTEIFNLNSVKSTMSSIEGEFETLSTKIGEINSEITTALGSPDEAMYGDAGNKVLATWDENCSTLNSFIKIFDSWSNLVSNMATEYGELESGTAKVQDEDKEALNTIAKSNKSSWLKTNEAKKAYVGSKSNYTDIENNINYKETNNLEVGKVIEYTDNDGNKIKDYYSLAGELIGTSITDKHGKITYRMDNKNVDSITTNEEKEEEKKKNKAKETLKENNKKREEEKRRIQEEEERKAREAEENGTTITLPEGLGKTHSYMGWQCITDKTSNQYQLIKAAGMNFDENGFGKIGDRYVVATTTTFGDVGDFINVKQADGSVIKCVIGDIKNQNDPGCNKWGHNNGTCVVEFVVDKSSWYGTNKTVVGYHPEFNQTITSITNTGNYFNQ